jgi:OOP family OmpA-OmpF porin
MESYMSRTRFASVVLLLLAGFAAHAGDGFALDTLQEAPAGDRFFSATDATVVGNMAPSVALQSGWSHDPLVLRSNGSVVANGRLVENQFGLRLGAAVPVHDVVLLDASVSLVGWQRGQTPFAEAPSIDSAALGDFRVGARVPILRGERLSLAAGLAVFLPTGATDAYASDGSLRATPGAMMSGRHGRFTYASDVGVELRRALDLGYGRTGSALRVGAAGGMLFLDGALQVGPELGGRWQFNNADGSSLEALLGARYRRGTFTFGAALGGRVFHDAAGAAPLRVIAQIGWTPAIG